MIWKFFKTTNNIKVEKKGNKQFRLKAKNLFLTYTNLNPQVELKQKVLKSLSLNLKTYGINEYTIAVEQNKTNNKVHIHAYISGNKPIDIKNPYFLDIEIDGETYHGNYQAAKNSKNVIEYCKKQGDFITNIKDKPKRKKPLAFLRDITREKGAQYAIDLMYNDFPELAVSRGRSIKKNLIDYEQRLFDKKSKEEEKTYSIESFDVPKEVHDWYKNRSTTALISGKSGLGKTELAKALVKHLNPLFINNINQLKDLKPENKAIIFDDIDARSLTREEKIALIDKDNNRTIRILYGLGKLSKTLDRIITTNRPEDFDLHLEEIARRITHINLGDKPLIINVKIDNIINNSNIGNNVGDSAIKIVTKSQSKGLNHSYNEDNIDKPKNKE